ncbi:ASCH domain-containing protein [Roseibium sp. Sym1]|uniref:ASCH domain-containing protein n=1 Tax=Roseibium sp. Sym1 TaxID=3016006 RepID=UPI0022B5AC9A|nr:ASCH domain-containing protein [Roseibium sp. Sym1]
MTELPKLALSVRQPWAWAIIHAGKDIENRSWQAFNHGLNHRGRVAIHASKGMTRAEYDHAANFIRNLGHPCPLPADLQRGGIIGSVEVVDAVKESASPWFFGPRGLVLREPQPCEFIPCKGVLGYFQWRATGKTNLVRPAKWMLPELPKPQGDLL